MKVAIRNCALLLCSALMPGVVAAPAQTTQSNEKTLTGKVSLIARDRDGKPVRDLKAEDLTVLDNGRPAKILALDSAGKLPVRIGILLAGDQSTFKGQQQAAIRLLGSLRPGVDQAFVLTQAIATNPRPWPNKKLNWDPDPKSLAASVGRLHWNEALSSTKDAVMAMLALNPDKPFRRVMLEFRDPQLETSVDYRTMPSKELDEILMLEIAEYQRRQAIVYATTLKTLRPLQFGFQSGSVKIERLAVMTGGRDLAWDKIESEVDALREDLDNEMLLSFEVQPGDPQRPHNLEIRVNRKDVRLAFPKQFYAATPPGH